jgi:hypothetical protein
MTSRGTVRVSDTSFVKVLIVIEKLMMIQINGCHRTKTVGIRMKVMEVPISDEDLALHFLISQRTEIETAIENL